MLKEGWLSTDVLPKQRETQGSAEAEPWTACAVVDIEGGGGVVATMKLLRIVFEDDLAEQSKVWLKPT